MSVLPVSTLKLFCGQDSINKNPWTGEGFTQATDGHILIRTGVHLDVLESFLAPLTGKLVESKLVSEWYPISEIVMPKEQDCPICKGKQTIECLECRGLGNVSFSSCFNSYICECKNCEGAGDSECVHCSGTGILPVKIPLGGTFFSSHYLQLLRDNIPDCEIGITGEYTPALLKFNDGDGLLAVFKPHN